MTGPGLLAISAGATEVVAAVVTGDSAVAVACGRRELHPDSSAPGSSVIAPEAVWQAVVAATRDCLAAWTGDPGDLHGIGVRGEPETLLVWDRETLGSPRPAILPGDRRASTVCDQLRAEGREDSVVAIAHRGLDPRAAGPRLRWLADDDPHTWALVLGGRYALGPVASYLVARMSRGTWHVADLSHAEGTLLLDPLLGAWSTELCGTFGVPLDALPDLVPELGPLARTDARSFLGLDLPVVALHAGPVPSDDVRPWVAALPGAST